MFYLIVVIVLSLLWTVFILQFSSVLAHSKCFTVQVAFTHSFIDTDIHSLLLFAAPFLSHHSYTAGTAVTGNLGFSILPRDTCECRLEEPGIPTFWLVEYPIYTWLYLYNQCDILNLEFYVAYVSLSKSNCDKLVDRKVVCCIFHNLLSQFSNTPQVP